ncbi:MAG: rubredoxin [Candidatus Methanomethylophilaceae archaeon]|nr:rubredoxin [Candidatus Methanomethylophilaceae archaeon]
MAVYKCSVCGEIYDDAEEPVKFEDLPDDWVCPLCRSPKSAFVRIDGDAPAAPTRTTEQRPVVKSENDLS